jgi:ABC-type bacteriocin/lantibiotic exporter with double-glycine peptidase domain
MNDAVTSDPAPAPSAPPQCTAEWSEAVWLDRLTAAVGAERRGRSPLAAALPSMLVALGWPGTARSLAALLPPPEVPLSLAELVHILGELGFRGRRVTARGRDSDTQSLRAGSLALRAGAVAVYLGQPEGRDRWLTAGGQDKDLADFELASGDAILAIDANPDFRPVDEARPKWFRGLFERIRDELFSLFAMSAFINVLALSLSLYTMVVYGTVIPSGAPDAVWGIALLAALAVAGGWALRVGRQRVISRLGGWTGTRIGEATMRKMLSFPLDTITRLGVQNNVIRMRSFENARQFLSGLGGTQLIDYPFVAIFLLVIGLLGGWLVFVPIVSLFCFAAIALPTADYVASKASAAGAASTRLEEHAGAALLGINAFHRVGAGSQWLSQFADHAREAAARNSEYAIAVARAQAIGHALGQLTVLATMGVGILLVLGGTMNAGGLIASMILIWRIVAPAQEAFSSLVRLRQIRNSVQQVDQLMATPTERASVEIASPLGIRNVTLTVERLYYRPDNDQEAALNGVSFSVPAGARVAIVGPNAGGKTALLECLAGLRQPQAGRILVNGRDIRQFDPLEYRAWVGYVPQDVSALSTTVRDYLRLRNPTLRDEDALLAFERVLGAGWQELAVFGGDAESLLDRQLNAFSGDYVELKLCYLVTFVAATIGSPQVLLLDGMGLGADPLWDERIEAYLDSIRGRTTVIWIPYSTAHIQSSDQMVLLDRGSVKHIGPTARPAAEAG